MVRKELAPMALGIIGVELFCKSVIFYARRIGVPPVLCLTGQARRLSYGAFISLPNVLCLTGQARCLSYGAFTSLPKFIKTTVNA